MIKTMYDHAKTGFDAAHIAMQDVNLGIDSFLYAAPKIRLRVRTANMKEKSGLIVRISVDHFLWILQVSIYLICISDYLTLSFLDGL